MIEDTSRGYGLTNVVAPQRDGEKDTVERSDGREQEETTDILLGRPHEPELVHGRDGGDEQRRQAS